MNEQEKLAFAETVRQRSRSEPVPRSVLDDIPAVEAVMNIPTAEGKCRTHWIQAANASDNSPLMINLHGGGFVQGHLDRDTLFCQNIAAVLCCRVLDMEYKLAPEAPYPAAVNQVTEAVRWVYDHAEALSFDTERVAYCGHGAGANLVCFLMKNRGEAMPMPRCAVLDYGVYDLLQPSTKKPVYAKALSTELCDAFNECYITPETAQEASPFAFSDEALAQFPDCLFNEAGQDALCAEGFALANRIACLGPEVTVKCYTSCIHGFIVNRDEGWEAATTDIQHYLARKLDCTEYHLADNDMLHIDREVFM